MKFFKGITTLQELKTTYRKLVLKHHPDVGGNEATMKAINNEYEKALQLIKDNPDNPDSKKAYYDIPKDFFKIIEALIYLEGIEVEICGSWIWVTGNTKQHAAYLKQNGCKWAGKKLAWYWHSGDYKKFTNKVFTLDEIREMHGSEKLESKYQPKLAYA